ncbi:(Fe-S)-binding protein [Methanosphaerula palustris]|uniref:Fe-S cluster domain protein n=1 Tax=Methanosphaerula palustris (strain ATCC BAA-1556 / DSM 19958 / E1-9c) TaxID=521011 RepID=B8GK27_METPE|nr:(Fe-S)-binding protein [Methanosphaerula palustris]ACL17098.1 Fe-S cluster domain protein [Methanosphaerula palustris E1-9c]
MVWEPPGKDCGACGVRSCREFVEGMRNGTRVLADCPHQARRLDLDESALLEVYDGTDLLGSEYDFILRPLPGEPSAQRYIQPFRPELVERLGIGPGAIVIGRPVDPGCPIQHVLRVLDGDPVSGILRCHTVGPLAARRSPKVFDLKAYREVAFEGRADLIRTEPAIGFRARFLPANCMRQIAHTGVVQMVLKKSFGFHVRLEDIQMHGKRDNLLKETKVKTGQMVTLEGPSGPDREVVINGVHAYVGDRPTGRKGDGGGGGGGKHHHGDGKGHGGG